MSKTAKWIIGIIVVLLVLQWAMPFVWQLVFPNAYAGYGMPMMGRGYNHPMMGGGFGHSMMGGFGLGGLIMGLLPLGLLILIGLGIAYLWKKLTEKPAK